ncbi:MAG: hypothetical protein ACRD2E_14090 [Terriglobales bacterium]
MEHVDAKIIRERLNVVALSIAMLESTAGPAQKAAITAAREALREIALLVTGDELDEHGQFAPPRLCQDREGLRREAESHTPADPIHRPGNDAAAHAG